MVIFQILVILQIEDHTKIVPFNRFRFFQDIDFLIAKKWSLLVGIFATSFRKSLRSKKCVVTVF